MKLLKNLFSNKETYFVEFVGGATPAASTEPTQSAVPTASPLVEPAPAGKSTATTEAAQPVAKKSEAIAAATSLPSNAYGEIDLLKVIQEASAKRQAEEVATTQTGVGNFATDLTPARPMSRRRPGPSMGMFMDMVQEMTQKSL